MAEQPDPKLEAAAQDAGPSLAAGETAEKPFPLAGNAGDAAWGSTGPKALAGHQDQEHQDDDKPIDLSLLPKWHEQLTPRALILGGLLGGVFCIITHNLNLRSGVIPSLNIAAGLLGFFFLKLFTELCAKCGLKLKPFTPQENTVVQTTVVACYGLAFYGGFGSYLLSMTPNVQQATTGGDPNGPGAGVANTHDITLKTTLPYMLLIGFTGLFSVTLLRKLMVVDYRLPYPSGTVTGIMINSFHQPRGEERAKKQVGCLGKFFCGSFLWSLFQWFFTASTDADGNDCSGGFNQFATFGLRAFKWKWYFDWSQTYIGAGMICPAIVSFSMIVGSVLTWGIQFPLISNHKAGVWYPEAANTSSNFSGLGAYEVFPALAVFIGDGGYTLVKMSWVSVRQVLRDRAARKALPAHSHSTEIKLRGQVGSNVVETTSERTARTTLFVTEKIPNWVSYVGYVCFAALATGLVPQIFPQVKWYYVIIAELIAPIFAVCNAYGMGLTDWNVASTYAKLGIFVFAAWKGSNGGIIAGLGMSGVLFGLVGAAADLMQDFKTGYLTMSSPKAMYCAQLWGMLCGCILAPTTFLLIQQGHPLLGLSDPTFQAPFAKAYRGIAVVGAEGFGALPDNVGYICLGWLLFAIMLAIIRDFTPRHIGRYVPIGMAMAIPFIVGANLAIDMALGAIIMWVWQKLNRTSADLYGAASASGLIVGDGIWTIVSSIIGVAGKLPPMCMSFAKGASS